MIFVGIDVGLRGAIAVISAPEQSLRDAGQEFEILIHDTPTQLTTPSATAIAKARRARKKVPQRREIDIVAAHFLVHQIMELPAPESPIVTIERQSPHGPKPGRAAPRSSFSLGEQQGVWRALWMCQRITPRLVLPQSWKPAMLAGLPSGTKGVCRELAERLFPDADLGARASEDRSEALLLAEYGRRLYNTGTRQ